MFEPADAVIVSGGKHKNYPNFPDSAPADPYCGRVISVVSLMAPPSFFDEVAPQGSQMSGIAAIARRVPVRLVFLSL